MTPNKSTDLNQDSERDAIAQSTASQVSQCAQCYMSAPVHTVSASATLSDAHAVFLRYGHTGLCVLDQADQLVGMLSRRDVEVALRHGLSHALVLTCMNVPVRAITPQASLHDAQTLMTTYDIGRLPVVASGKLLGIITRSDILRQQSLKPVQRSLSTHEPPLDSPQSGLPVAADMLYQQLVARSGTLWPALEKISKAATSRGWALYVVGGAVRDLCLSCMGHPQPLTDIDLVVEGAESGAGVILAEAIQSSDPQVDLKIYGEFQTASLTWPSSSPNASFSRPSPSTSDVSHVSDLPVELVIDIATARTEFYPYPAANPEVESSTIHQDLYRRDFTINAMALRLDGPSRGQLLDFFGGWIDLQQRHIKVIHPNSFIEDPTRVFRAVRFAVRLDFALETQTEAWVRYALDSQTYLRVQSSGRKVPALQSRLTAELKKLLSATHWKIALSKVDQLGALACLHPALSLTPSLFLQLQRMSRWQRQFLPAQPLWRLLLVLLIAQLEPVQRGLVATALNLDSDSQNQLNHLHEWETELLHQLPNATKPSEVYQRLHPYKLVEQLLIVARHPYTLGPQIWHHIVQLSRMPPLINGGTLKRLGYLPGPQFREILTAVHQATLDGELDSVNSAESYVLAHYPVSQRS